VQSLSLTALALHQRLREDAFIDLRPFGKALTHSLNDARLESDGIAIWEEEDYCSPPLAQERAAVLDTYFDDITVERVNAGEGWKTKVLSKLQEPIRYSPDLDATVPDLIRSVQEQGLEGLVAKCRTSVYESSQRSGAWLKMRVNRGQEFVIGGYTPGLKNFDALIFGYYKGDKLMYVARTRNGFTPALREKLFQRFRQLETADCPFANLPEARSGRWGQGLTAAKMKECRWLKPRLVGQFEFAEWTPENHLRHSRFVELRDDKDPREVKREI
jgi:ATP-dependent DNA ligase